MISILENKQVQDYLDSQDYDSLNWIMSRYCGPNNELLFLKSYGHFNIKQQKFHEEVKRRLFNQLLEEELSY